MDDLDSTLLIDLGFDKKVCEGLREIEIETIGQLKQTDIREIMKIRGFGTKRMQRLLTRLIELDKEKQHEGNYPFRNSLKCFNLDYLKRNKMSAKEALLMEALLYKKAP